MTRRQYKKALREKVEPLKAQGLNLTQIAEKLNEDGFRSQRGRLFNFNSLSQQMISAGIGMQKNKKRSRASSSVTDDHQDSIANDSSFEISALSLIMKSVKLTKSQKLDLLKEVI